jgi:hypothetical protein
MQSRRFSTRKYFVRKRRVKMTESIIKIEMDKTFKLKEDSWYSFDGVVVTTNKQEIKLGIENGQSCCENWGYFITNDDTKDFIGADVLSIDIVDTCLNKEAFEYEDEYNERSCMFVNIETSEGTLQFTAYNEHNGYYGHEAVVVSSQLVHEECL